VPESYSESALRHSADADHLASSNHLDGAGYLIGFAVECAIKSAIVATRPAANTPHMHLPKLVDGAKKTLQGRRKHSIFKVLEQTTFMQGWSIDVRYAKDGAVNAALQRAADFQPAPKHSAIDYVGIRAGVQEASRVRVRQLKEDYDWIDKAMGALEGLEVPCDPSTFIRRWAERKTVAELRAEAKGETRRLPLELVTTREAAEEALLRALETIGVIEFRTENRINMPDIFRVEAGIKRRGGVRPPSSRRG
jgi:hypothetical protein